MKWSSSGSFRVWTWRVEASLKPIDRSAGDRAVLCIVLLIMMMLLRCLRPHSPRGRCQLTARRAVRLLNSFRVALFSTYCQYDGYWLDGWSGAVSTVGWSSSPCPMLLAPIKHPFYSVSNVEPSPGLYILFPGPCPSPSWGVNLTLSGVEAVSSHHNITRL